MPISPLFLKLLDHPSASPFQSSMSMPIVSNRLKLNTTLPSPRILHSYTGECSGFIHSRMAPSILVIHDLACAAIMKARLDFK